MLDLPNTQANAGLASAVNARIGADARMLAAKAAFWRFLGLSIFAVSLGIGAAIALWGYARVNDVSVTADALAAALAKALEGAKLSATLDPNASVKLDPESAQVRLDPASVKPPDPRPPGVDAALKPRPEPSGAQKPARAVQTNYTVFKSVKFAQGEVVAGYNFAGDDLKPHEQYCYYTTGGGPGGTSLQTDLARDAVYSAPQNPPAKLDVRAAAANCVWFDGQSTRFPS